jgi:cysteine desulfurase
MYSRKGKHIVTVTTEHKAVVDTARHLAKEGYDVTFLKVKEDGLIDLNELEDCLSDQTILVSVMFANNEIGVIQPIKEISALARKVGALFMTDATQAAGKVPIDVEEMGIDLLAFTGHKIYGPKGVGALYVRRKNPRVKVTAQMDGGGHERGMRSGTLNVPGIVGFGRAAELCRLEMPTEAPRIRALRDRLENTLLEKLEESYLNGNRENRLPNIANISFKYVEGEGLMMAMADLAVSSGSACTSASLEPSYVLKALGLDDELAHSSIRYSLGRFNTEQDVDFAIEKTILAVNKLRDMSPLWEMYKDGVDLKSVVWAAH